MNHTWNEALPSDFAERILKHVRVERQTLREALDDAVLAMLGRPLTMEEKWAIIDNTSLSED